MRLAQLCMLAAASSLCLANAQFTVPGITVTPQLAAPALEVARTVLVQPARLEMRLAPGYTTGMLTFSLLSEVLTEVTLETSDERMVVRTAKVRLQPQTPQSVSLLARGAHQGLLRVRNSAGELLAQVSYEVAAPKSINQNLSLNYTPRNQQGSLSYSVSGVSQSVLDPRWSASVSLNLNARTGDVGGSVGVNVGW